MEKTPRLVIAVIFWLILFINVAVLENIYGSWLPPLTTAIQLLDSFGLAGFSYAILEFIKRKKISLPFISALLIGMIVYQYWSYSTRLDVP